MIKWISCKDRLPVVGDRVIFIAEGSYINIGSLGDDLIWESEEQDTYGRQELYNHEKVTHWSEINDPEDAVEETDEKEFDIANIISLSLTGRALGIVKRAVEVGHTRCPIESHYEVGYVELVSQLSNAGLIKIVDPTEEMLKYVSFQDEESKKKFISKFMFCIPTGLGKLVVAMVKEKESAVQKTRTNLRNDMKKLKFDIASNLLDSIGLDLEEMISERVDD